MFDDRLIELWQRSEAPARELSRGELEALVQPGARRVGRGLSGLLATHAAMLAVTALLALANLPLYRANPSMLTLELALAGLGLVGVAVTLSVLRALRRLADPGRPLLQGLGELLELQEVRLARWSHAAAFTPLLLTLAINTRLDALDGRYPIHSPVEFAAVSIGMTILTWFLTRRSLALVRSETRALAADLAAETLSATSILPGLQRRGRRELLAGVLLVSLALAVSLWLWLANT